MQLSHYDPVPANIQEQSWGRMDVRFDTCEQGEAHLVGVDGEQSMDIVRFVGVDFMGCEERYSPPADTTQVSGSWYDPATAGQGFAIHLIDSGSFVAYFYGFADDQSPLWLIGVHQGGIQLDTPIDVGMNITSGGKFGGFDPGDISETPWGSMTITFQSCDTATVTMDGLNGKQSLNTELFVPVLGTQHVCSDDAP